jgi:hypothetical protein
MAFIYLIFIVAAAISAVAAYFSLVGLGALFAATFWGVVVMAGVLEVGKIVATKWVHSNWQNPAAPWYFRGLFCVFIAALMTITSLGIYGYLSKGHLEQNAPLVGLNIQSAQLDTQLQQKQAENQQLMTRLDQIARITDKSLESGGRAGLRASSSQKSEAAQIQKKIDANNQAINDLNTKLVPLKTQGAEVEAKLGPVKYVAELFGWDPESAVRIIICIIMIAFDPLALSLFIAGSISLKSLKNSRKAEEAVEMEDYIFPARVDGMGSKVTELPNGEDLDWVKFKNSVPSTDDGQEAREAALAEANDAIEKEREEFQTAMTEATDRLQKDIGDLETARETIEADRQALSEAHTQLLDMEARINDEAQLLKDWEDQLKAQQEAINNWKPTLDLDKTPKDVVIELLEKNPDIVHDIVQVASALRKIKPGL